MMWVKIILVAFGLLLIFGAVGQSDRESLTPVPVEDATPFWKLALLAVTGVVMVVLGAILPNWKEVRASGKIRIHRV